MCIVVCHTGHVTQHVWHPRTPVQDAANDAHDEQHRSACKEQRQPEEVALIYLLAARQRRQYAARAKIRAPMRAVEYVCLVPYARWRLDEVVPVRRHIARHVAKVGADATWHPRLVVAVENEAEPQCDGVGREACQPRERRLLFARLVPDGNRRRRCVKEHALRQRHVHRIASGN